MLEFTLMVIGACQLQLHLPGGASLKEKRALIKPLLVRLHREFNVAAAEVDSTARAKSRSKRLR